jgi:hypothetical protein
MVFDWQQNICRILNELLAENHETMTGRKKRKKE